VDLVQAVIREMVGAINHSVRHLQHARLFKVLMFVLRGISEKLGSTLESGRAMDAAA